MLNIVSVDERPELSGELWEHAVQTAENMIDLARKAHQYTRVLTSRDQLADPDQILNTAADFRDAHADEALPLLVLALVELAR